MEVLGDIEQHLLGMLFRSVLCGVYRERNNNIFEGEECFIIELKQIFLLSLFEWRTALNGLAIPSILDFQDLCSFG